MSRLYNKDPATWERVLSQIEGARGVMLAQYAPLRHAIATELTRPGTGGAILESGLGKMKGTPTQSRIAAKSREAFRTFLADIAPQVSGLVENFLRPDYVATPIPFADAELEGRFHLAVSDKLGRTKYVYLSAADWDHDETDSFIELLTIVAEARHASAREDVWFVDFRSGTVVSPQRSFKERRARLAKTVKLLSRLLRALNQDY